MDCSKLFSLLKGIPFVVAGVVLRRWVHSSSNTGRQGTGRDDGDYSDPCSSVTAGPEQGVEQDYHSFIIRSVSRLEPLFYIYALSFNDYLLQL